MRKVLSAILIIIAILLCLQFFIRPSVVSQKTMEDVSEDELVYAGEDEHGTSGYIRLKEEIKDWTEILKGLGPIASLVMAYFIGKKK